MEKNLRKRVGSRDGEMAQLDRFLTYVDPNWVGSGRFFFSNHVGSSSGLGEKNSFDQTQPKYSIFYL